MFKISPFDRQRLVLGTAQLGMDYGIANMSGRPAFNTARSIIQEVWKYGLREFDTAQVYSQSERVLGQAFKELGIATDAEVTTKFASHVDYSDGAILNKALESSINNLGVESLYCLMLHREDMLDLWEKDLGKKLMSIVDSGRVKHIGASVYSPEKAIQALNIEGISIVQLPTNIFDGRFDKAGVFQIADDLRKTIYIRSIFLQGLLLMPFHGLPQHMHFAAQALKKLAEFTQDVCLTAKELCIGYLKNAFPNSRVVFGVETVAQVKENLKYWDTKWSHELTQKIQTEFSGIDEIILNPSLWPLRTNGTGSIRSF